MFGHEGCEFLLHACRDHSGAVAVGKRDRDRREGFKVSDSGSIGSRDKRFTMLNQSPFDDGQDFLPVVGEPVTSVLRYRLLANGWEEISSELILMVFTEVNKTVNCPASHGVF